MSLTKLGIEDPIEEAFPLMVAAAERSCQDRDQPVRPCYSYHRLWPYSRILGLKGSAWRHGQNYLARFRACAREGRKRLLITGAADYAMLAMALKAYREEGVEPAITVIDLCDAPLAVNRWYAERLHASITTVACSIFDYRQPEAFDVVATDQFLNQFPSELVDGVLVAWREALVPGGKVITAQGIGSHVDSRFKQRQLGRLGNISDAAIAAVGVDRATIEAYMNEFNASRNRLAFTDVAEILDLFCRHGFSVDLHGYIPDDFQRSEVDAEGTFTQRRMFFEATKA